MSEPEVPLGIRYASSSPLAFLHRLLTFLSFPFYLPFHPIPFFSCFAREGEGL